MSRGILNSNEHTDPDLAAVFSRWYTGVTEHRMHFKSSYAKISAAIDLVTRFVLADLCRLLDDGAQLFAHLKTDTSGSSPIVSRTLLS